MQKTGVHTFAHKSHEIVVAMDAGSSIDIGGIGALSIRSERDDLVTFRDVEFYVE